ncbi:hypothetical protein [Glutamicibacter ardleyensis]
MGRKFYVEESWQMRQEPAASKIVEDLARSSRTMSKPMSEEELLAMEADQ